MNSLKISLKYNKIDIMTPKWQSHSVQRHFIYQITCWNKHNYAWSGNFDQHLQNSVMKEFTSVYNSAWAWLTLTKFFPVVPLDFMKICSNFFSIALLCLVVLQLNGLLKCSSNLTHQNDSCECSIWSQCTKQKR